MTGQIQGFRLSPQQRRLWSLQQPGGTLRAQCALRLPGRLDAERLRQALQGMVDRHDMLRTTFHRTPGIKHPVQVVAERGTFSLGIADLTGGVEESERGTARLLDEEAGRHDLENGPVLRCLLAALPGGENALLISLPPVCADAWSLYNLAAELLRAYAGSPDLPEADGDGEVVPYLQFSEWLHELLESPEAEVGREHWRRQESLRLPAPALPFQREQGRAAGSAAMEVRRHREALSWPRLAAAAGSLGASPEAFLLAAWQTLLARLAGASKVVVGAVVDGRKYEELHGTLGPFSHALPVAVRLAEESPFTALLEAVRGELEDAVNVQEYCDWQGEWDEEMGPGSGAVGFELAVLPGELDGALLSLRCELDRFKLKLTCRREGEALAVEIRGAAGLFAAEDLARLAERFAALLASAMERPRTAWEDLEVLGAAERRQLLVESNATSVPLPAGATLASLFAEQARRTPEAVALEQGGRRVTFAELDTRSNRLANHLLALGAVPDVTVAVLLERGLDLVVALLAALKAGAAYLPLDPGHPEERLRAILGEARPFALVTREGLAGRLAGGALGALEVISLDAAQGRLAACDAADPGVPVTGDHLAYVLYTSGSTGRPKGVMVTQRGLLNYLLWAAKTYPVSWGEGSPVHSPIVFDLTVTSLFLPLLAGRRAVLVPEEEGIEGLCSLVRDRGGFGLLKLTPSHLQVLTQWLQPEQAPGRAGALVLGGEALLAESLFFWRARAPETRLFNEYGPTETVVGCVVYEVRPAVSLSGPVPIGRPIDNTRCYVLDAALRPVPSGLPGELYLAGAGLARGYLGRPDLTAERFVPDPFGGAGERLYRTGDLVRWTEGELVFAGRTDQQVKLHGYRIELGEIEAALAALPGVREAAAVLREDTPGDPRLAAYYVPETPAPAEAELRAGLEARLPAYMIPAALVSLPELPLTANGKIDRAALPAPGTGRPDLVEAYVAPESETEEILAAIVGQVLHLDAVGVLDNFFALGGDSIRSVQIVAHARERGLELNVEDLFRHQTIRALASSVGATSAAAEVPRTVPFELIPPAERGAFPADVEDAYPLTLLQSGMLYHMGLTAERPAFHNVNTWHIRAAFDAGKLQAAVDRVVARHAVMRTSFDLTSYGQPLQLVHRTVELRIGCDDLRHLEAAEQVAMLREFWERENRLAFDLSRAPLIRYHVHRRSEDTFQFTLTELHVVLDGWSTTSTLSEIFQTYFALLRGEPLPQEPPLSLTFRDFVAVERRELALEENRRFWTEKLRGSAPTRLPRLPAAHRGRRGKWVEKLLCPVPGEVFENLRRLSRQEALPLKSVLLAAHLKALSVLSGERDIVTALASNGRLDVPDGTQVRGLFLNLLPLRIELRGGSWAELARQAFEAERELQPYRRYPLAAIQKLWGGHDLSETLFNYLNFHSVDDVLRLGEGEILDDDEIDFSYTNFTFDACFLWIPLSLRMLLLLEYNPEELDHDQALLYQGCYLRILEQMAADPRAPYDTMCGLSAAEREQALVGWNPAPSPYPEHLTVDRVFSALAARTPDAEALVFGGRRLSYGELDRLSNQLSHHLRALGVGPQNRVAICLDRCWEMIVALLGILKAGGTYVPLDPSYPRERLAYMVEDAGAGVLLTRGDLASGLPAAAVVRLDEDAPAIAARPEVPLDGRTDPDGLAYVIYTSGSTGRPKGVAVPHRAILRLVLGTDYVTLAPGDGVAQAANASFDAATFEIWGALLNGARLVGVDREVVLSPARLGETIRAEGITTLFLTTALFHQIADQAPDAFGSLTHLLFGGEAIDPRRVRRVLEAGGPARLLHVYGPTECTTYATWHRVSEVPADATTVPIGRAIANTRAYVVDGGFQPVPAGTPGELVVGGPGLARGYLDRPDLTAEKFVPDPLSGELGQRLYRTGDRVRWLPGGALEFLGRRDGQVKVRGFRIELSEIEAALVRHPAVRQAVVAVYEPAPGERRLVAYPVLETEPAVAPEELRDFLRRELPEPMIPSAFVPLTELPINPNGKIDRRALPAPTERPLLAQGYVEPRTEIERELAAVWREVMGLDRVGAQDDFFALGGDSILSLRIVALARQRGIGLSIEQLFSHPELAELAEVVAMARDSALPPPTEPLSLVPAVDRMQLPPGIEDAYPTTQLQLGMLFHLRLTPESPAYHNVYSWHLRAPFDPVALQWAVDRAVQRHPTLRTSFALSGYSEPLQLVHGVASLPVVVADLRHLEAAEQEEVISDCVRSEHSRMFDLARPPLMRLQLHRRGERSFQLTVTECHAISDGWSTTSLLSGIFREYLDLSAGEAPPEDPAAGFSFRDFVALERQALASEECRLFWDRLLAEAVPPALPAGPPIAQAGVRAHKIQEEVSSEVLAGLERLAREEKSALKSVLLAAHVAVLAWLSGGAEVLTGLTSNGRPEHADAERVHGLFLNTLPLWLRLPGGTWRELVRMAFDAERQALPYRRYPLAALQRARGRQALVETNFNFVSFRSVRDVLRSERLEILEGEELGLAFSNFALSVTFALSPVTAQLRMELECDAARFSRFQAELFAQGYRAVLAALAVDPEGRYDAPLAQAVEPRPAIIVASAPLNGEPRLFLQDWVAGHARRQPGAPAAVFGDERLTYGELERRSRQLARRLRSLGTGPGDLVGIAMERSLELVVAILGVLKAGAAFLPIDPGLPRQRISFMLEDARPVALLTQPGLTAELMAGGVPILELDSSWREIAGEDDGMIETGVSAEDLAYVIYTSGSTGTPKGALLRHGGLANLITAQQRAFAVRPDERVLQFASLSFDAAVFEIAMAYASGASLHLATREELLPGPGLVELLRRQAITNLTIPPSVLTLLPDGELPDLRTVIVAGEACPAELTARWAPGRRFFNAYGPTETTVWASAHLVVEPGRRPPIGSAIAGVTLHVLDPWLRPVLTGAVGELFIGGEGVARGYLRRPDLTARSFVPDPWSERSGARLYRTGDLVRRSPDGELEFIGRADGQVKVRGFRTELGEIEAVMGRHPAVRQAVVMARGDDAGGKRLVAYWSSAVQPAPGVSELRAFLGERLPAYMVPALFVCLESIPLTSSGKVDRHALPAPDSARPDLAAAYALPRGDSERLVASVWGEVLGLDRVGAHDNFFDLGGDSLLLLQVHERLRAATGREISLLLLFELPTVSALAGWLDDESGGVGTDEDLAGGVESGRDRLLLQRARGLNEAETDLEIS
jgi:amino acid adenylation domain-containing protein